MFTTSFTSPHRLSGYMLMLLLSSVCLCADVAAQVPLVVSSSAVAVPHNESYGNPWQTSVSTRGDFLLFDFKSGGLYVYPATGGPEITLGAPSNPFGGFTDSGIAIDPRNNNLYLDNNYNGGIVVYPYDAATGAWDLPSQVVANNLSGNLGGSCGNFYQDAGLAINDHGVMAVATENGCGVEIFTVPIDAAGNFGSATPIVANMNARAKTVAIDNAGNIYYNEDSGGLAGALFIPAGTTGLNGESTGVVRIDPSLGNVQGVSVDRAGNVYVSDGSAGEYLVPFESGAPNPLHAILLSLAPASGGPSIDPARGVLFVPTSGFGSLKDLTKIYLNRLELGTVTAGTTGATPGTVTYDFNGTATPKNFIIEQAGTSGTFALGDFAGCGITPNLDKDGHPILDKNGNPTTNTTTYNVNGTCSLSVSFTPHSVGDVSANLVMLDASGNILNTMVLHGVGHGSAIVVTPGTESSIGSALKTPSQVAADTSGNVYIADSGLGKVLEYTKGAGATTVPVSIGTGLTAPTGVAVDGAGDVFIADSGNVIEVPYGTSGLNAAGQVTLQSGLGTNLKLAVDKIGDVFVTDPDNQRVLRVRNIVDGVNATNLTGFSQLSAIAAGSGALLVANGQNLIEFSAVDAGTTVLTSLPSGVNGLAVDASGAVYVTTTSETIRIPNEGGVLNTADQITLASGVTKPTSVAVDSVGNAYVTDAGAENVDFINANGFVNFGTLANTTSTQTGSVTIVNNGNVPLNITGFASAHDFSETASTCIGAPIAVGASCTANLIFNPGPGGQGNLSEQILVQSDAANTPIGINVIGVAAPLLASTTTLTVTKPSVTSAPISVKVASTSGTGPVPTGTVTLTITGNGLKTPVTITQPLTNGAVSFNPTELVVGSYTFTVTYNGDRIYGISTASTTTTVGQGTVMLIQPAASTVPVYVLSEGQGSQEPFDSSQNPFLYNYPVTVKTADGNPLIGMPIFNAKGTQTGTDYGAVSFQVSPGNQVCSGTAAIVNVNADGTAPFATDCLNINTSNNQIPDLATSYTFTPVYNGNTDPNYSPATGTPVTVIALRNPMVIITSNPSSLNVTAGSSATATLTLTSLLGYGVAGATGSLNNYGLPLELECDGLPAHASCTFSYPTHDPSDPNSVACQTSSLACSVTVTPTTPGKVTMTVNTNAPVGTSSLRLGPSGTTFATMFGLGLLGLTLRRKRSLRGLVLTVVCVLFCSGMVAGITACSSKQLSAAPILTTPGGTYTVTVTAKQTGSRQVPGSQAGQTLTVYGNQNQMSIPFTMKVTVQ
jgi:sugar lactone lactonase YvrE